MAQSSSINNRTLYRLLTLLAVRLFERYRPHSGRVLLSKRLCIKYGRLVNLSEASTLRFISKYTSIPVPKVFCGFVDRGQTYIVMERIQGKMAGRGWIDRRPESQTKILVELKEMVRDLRNISPVQSQGIANVNGGQLFDCRLPGGPSPRFGPFDHIADFHTYLRYGIQYDPGNDPEINKLIDLHGGCWPLVFTHGDLSSLNVLIREDSMVGIIDWETSGWYPAYWKYTAACQVNPQNSFWRHEIDRFLDPFPLELLTEHIRQKYFGDV